MSMPALSLWQPWASLLVTRRHRERGSTCTSGLCDARGGGGCFTPWCGCGCHHAPLPSMVKRFETLSWPCPPSLIGQRFAIHAAARRPEHMATVGRFMVNRKGDGSTVMYDEEWCRRNGRDVHTDLPLGAVVGSGIVTACYPIVADPEHQQGAFALATVYGDVHVMTDDSRHVEYPGQAPYGDFTPGRYAWLIEDAAPITERCPWCWIEGCHTPGVGRRGRSGLGCICFTCNGTGRCDPIAAKGRQRIWRWTPELVDV